MPIVRDISNPFAVADWTQELLIVPNMYGKIQQMGLFQHEAVATNTVNFEQINQTIGLIGDRPRGERNNVGSDYTRLIRAYSLPHFPLDDAIKPEDIQGKAAYGGAGSGQPEMLDLVRARKLEQIRRNHAQTLETARVRTLTTGDIYAPNGTIAGNFYTDFSVTRKEVDFDLSTTTTNVLDKVEEVVAHIQDNAFTGDVINEVVALCSPEFFSALISHASVVAAYSQYVSVTEPLRRGGRMMGSAGGLDREFVHGAIRFVEYRGFDPEGLRFIPAGEAYFVPMGTDGVFKTYFGPANRFEFTNTFGMEAYVFEQRNASDTEIKLQSESNFLNVIRRPQLVVKGTA